MANSNKRVKIAGYAKRIFFNDNIEYRNFSPDLVGFQLTSEGGTTLFTNGNFSISVNLDPKPNAIFTQGTKSKFFTLDDISNIQDTQIAIQQNKRARLNIDLTDPLSYVWYGSLKELIRVSLIEIQDNWPAAIYVDNKVGSVTGNNITDYVYDISADKSTFKVNSNFFVNPYNIKYTTDAQYTPTQQIENPLRNFTINYSKYNIEHNGIKRRIKSITPAPQKTNSEIEIVVEGNPFPELTGIFIPQLSFLSNNIDASIPYFIKPIEDEIEKFFSGLNEFQSNLLNRNIYPEYTSEVISTNFTEDGVILTSKKIYNFPLLDDGYNLNFFDSFYIAYLDKLNELGEGTDGIKTDIILRKYTTEAISSFDTVPRGDGDDLIINGEKATKLLRIYGVEFDYIKKYINGIKFAHVVTYNKKNNVPDVLIKDLAYMLGLDPITFITDTSFSKIYLPSNGDGEFAGTSVKLTQEQIDIELYRRLILNIAWLWKSKGSRKAVEFLFRFIGAPESLVNFNEYVVLLDKPLDMEELKRLLYIYTGEVNLQNIPYDDNGFPLPPSNGNFVVTSFIDPQTGELVENQFTEMYFQKAGGWYRETYGTNSVTLLSGNNPHVGPYDGGSEYLQYFSRCYIPNFDNEPTVVITAKTLSENYFLNYNYGIFNGVDNTTTDFYTTQLTFNTYTGNYQPVDNCLNVNYSIIETPLQSDGTTTLQQSFSEAEAEYNAYLELIQNDSYLVYSPEWQVIKNNYELSLRNCLNEISTENCDINQTLEICIEKKEEELIEFSCDSLTLNECSPFYYFTNSDGIKVSFDEFPACCKEISPDNQYVSFINEYGRVAEYCAYKAPCIGRPIEVLEDGIVVFDIGTNTVSNDLKIDKKASANVSFVSPTKLDLDQVYTINGKCYRINSKGIETLTKLLNSRYTIDGIVKILSDNTKNKENNFLFENFTSLFVEVDCNTKTIVSSPECCAWYGFDYQIVKVDGNCFIACIQRDSGNDCIENQFIEEPLIPVSASTYEEYTIPYIDYTSLDGYVELQNPINGTQDYYTTEVYDDCYEESVIIKGVVVGSNTLSPQFYSLFDDPSFMNPTNWIVYSIDEYGRVSFTPSSFENDFILDWNYSDPQLNDLYQQVAEYYNYSFGTFVYDYNNNTLIPYNGNGDNTAFSAAVDPTYFNCNDVNSVSVVFASEGWKGFKLPRLEDCSCTIDFSFDYMIKYKTEDLLNCANNVSCFPAIISDNTISNLNCLNFVAFTNSVEESANLVANFNDGSPEEEQTIWQSTNVLEPNIECCTALGGNVVSFTQWNNINQQWISTIDQNYNQLSTNPTIEYVNSLGFYFEPMIEAINNYESIKNDVLDLPEECFNFDLSLSGCDINYSCYITTQNVCSLQIPLECGLWTKIYFNYKTLRDEIQRNILIANNYIIECEREVYNGDTSSISAQVDISGIKNKSNEELTTLKTQSIKLNDQIATIDAEIAQKISDNNIIEKSLSNVNNPIDCTVYSDKIKEIDNFDYKSYCTSIVYGDGPINGFKSEEYISCVKQKTSENEENKKIYSELLNYCETKNSLTEQLKVAKFDNNELLVTELEKQLNDVNQKINTLTNDQNNVTSYDESLQKSKLSENDTQNTINRTAELLNTTPKNITDSSGNLNLTDKQKLDLNIQFEKNKSAISDLNNKKGDFQDLLNTNQNKAALNTTLTNEAVADIKDENSLVETDCGTLVNDGTGSGTTGTVDCCEKRYYVSLNDSLNEINELMSDLYDKMINCHSDWNNLLIGKYEEYEIENNSYFSNYLDDLKINFKLFVDNNNIEVQNNIDTSLTYLPYTQSVNPIWEWNPTDGYTGIILEGDDQEISVIKEGVFNYLSNNNIAYNADIFEPDWKVFNFTIPECVCDDLRRLYPNKEFFFSIEVEKYECPLCLLVDNIQVNVADCQTNRILSINDCMIPQLSCVIDNKKSWVYYDDGIIKETIYPDGECNTASTRNYEVIKLGGQQERLWLDLEYRYTDYSVNHSDLVLNVKNTVFSIDPAKAIECDVFNYWKNIDCDNCPTKCMEDSKAFQSEEDFLFQDCNTYIFEDQSTELTIVFSGEVLNSGYTLTFEDIVTEGLTFSCSTYTDILEQQVLELKNKYYALTSNYVESLDATYYDLLELGDELTKFYVQKNNCGTDTLVINDTSSLNNLFGVITENYDGSISLFETYLYTGSTPYTGGSLSEVLSGVTAQTYNQKLDIDENCCVTLNNILNNEGFDGLGLGKHYQWDSSICSCMWKPLNECSDCKGDCEYCGSNKECVNGFATGDTYNVCINPLDYLDIPPSEINIKAVFDQLVQTNLIDVKSRQTISDYPLLRLFYELYLTASNCGKDLSGQYTYDTMFEFMDKIGDYWLDLLEQVVPATTIWEGCDNSGKIYRNTIFDQNKFKYKKYSLNFIETDISCPLSAQTDYSIGSESFYSLVEQIPIYPYSQEISDKKQEILQKEIEISQLIKVINVETSKLCALNLQDLDTPNLGDAITAQQNQINLLNEQLTILNIELNELKDELNQMELEYLQQQENYYSNFMSCSGITQSLMLAEQNLSNYTPGTTAYERHRNFIAGLRNKYTKCVRESNTLISDYNTVFITQIYDSNEYEGNITIVGDPDWDEGGPFYNQELIHNC